MESVFTQEEATQKAGWFISAFNIPNAWTYARGKGVVVAVIDCGCQLDHEDLAENIVAGKNFINENQEPWDDSISGHGTAVCGIICAENNDIGIVGVAPEANIMPIKVLDKYGTGNFEIVANGIKWAADHGSDIMCMSLG
jgi:major intracellular serine protease